jgi:hypothetical protein
MKTLLLILCFCGIAAAQSVTGPRLKVEAGVSVPQAPDQFYDYWSSGVHVSVTSLVRTVQEYTWFVSLEYNRFAFDDDRFLQRMNMSGSSTTVTGAVTTNSQLTGGLYYFLRPYEQVTPFFLGGAAAAFYHMSAATVQYPYLQQSQGSEFKFYLALQYGTGLSYPLTETADVVVTMKRTFGVKRDKTVNTDFTTFQTGIIWYMD